MTIKAEEMDTTLTLEIKIGQEFANLPPEMQSDLFFEAIKTLVKETLPRAVQKMKHPSTTFPFKVSGGLALVHENTVEGQNLLDELGIDLNKETPI